MNIRRATLTAALLATSIVTTTATAGATPQSEPEAVTYHAGLEDRSVVTTLDHGRFTLAEDQRSVAVVDIAGQVLDALPLSLSLDGQQLPIRSQVSEDGRTLRLTPDVSAIDRTALKPVASPLENQLAMNDLINAVSLGTSIGSLIGTAIGAAVGIGVGFAVAGASCLVLSIGCVVAVLPIVSLVGAAGGLAGLVIAGGPTAAYGLYEYVSTLRADPGQSKYAANLQGKPGIPAAATDAPR
ncbi:hypothetical protein [Nocardia inohanensis]|uniref:hypothetical protein n=1 Tax=Nocardia inohanensis TaxID=209246 RepID=UPI00082DDD1D|nr:hypothetical protein [Nocardia inohanensis]